MTPNDGSPCACKSVKTLLDDANLALADLAEAPYDSDTSTALPLVRAAPPGPLRRRRPRAPHYCFFAARSAAARTHTPCRRLLAGAAARPAPLLYRRSRPLCLTPPPSPPLRQDAAMACLESINTASPLTGSGAASRRRRLLSLRGASSARGAFRSLLGAQTLYTQDTYLASTTCAPPPPETTIPQLTAPPILPLTPVDYNYTIPINNPFNTGADLCNGISSPNGGIVQLAGFASQPPASEGTVTLTNCSWEFTPAPGWYGERRAGRAAGSERRPQRLVIAAAGRPPQPQARPHGFPLPPSPFPASPRPALPPPRSLPSVRPQATPRSAST